MSAYGTILAPRQSTVPLSSTAWLVAPKAHPTSPASSTPLNTSYLTIHHLTLTIAQSFPGLLTYLHRVFADEIEAGLTYPQEVAQGEVYTREAFEAYFLAGDAFVAITRAQEGAVEGEGEVRYGIEEARAGRGWDVCVAGFYYVKPNYPGRSSHICNAGFVIPPSQRGKRFGPVLGRSYLHYAPKLGYTASVFNLVYVNNIASVRIWESLGFSKAGLIPKAGRLKKREGAGEEYVDAWVFYKSFLD